MKSDELGLPVVDTAAMQSLFQDEAYRLESRGVIALEGDCTVETLIEALQPLVCSSLAGIQTKPKLTYIVDGAGLILADLFVISQDNRLLLDCASTLLKGVVGAIKSVAESHNISVTDVSDQWSVFGELPDQNTYDDGSEFIKYADPRWHMGHRLLRPAAFPPSDRWGSELKWTAHAFKLGFLPGADLLFSAKCELAVNVAEAGLHSIGLLDNERLPPELEVVIDNPKEQIGRRILPMRVEPSALVFPTMDGQAIVADGEPVASVIAHRGLYGLALVELEPWRSAQAAGKTLFCADQQVLLTWPSWLAQESLGRGGPVASAEL